MNITYPNLTIAALATWQIIEIWHHSSLMARWRAITQTWDNFFGRVLNCMFCLTPWVSWLVCSIVFVPVPPWDGTFANLAVEIVTLLQFVILGFAIARLANLGNDLTRGYCLTPNTSTTVLQVDDTTKPAVANDDDDVLDAVLSGFDSHYDKKKTQ